MNIKSTNNTVLSINPEALFQDVQALPIGGALYVAAEAFSQGKDHVADVIPASEFAEAVRAADKAVWAATSWISEFVACDGADMVASHPDRFGLEVQKLAFSATFGYHVCWKREGREFTLLPENGKWTMTIRRGEKVIAKRDATARDFDEAKRNRWSINSAGYATKAWKQYGEMYRAWNELVADGAEIYDMPLVPVASDSNRNSNRNSNRPRRGGRNRRSRKA
jgi:hypothetical protein